MKYITTPIYYPNAKAHIGTAYTTILCDTLARYERLYGQEVKFLTGTDEHGQKIQESAEKNNVTPQQWVDKIFYIPYYFLKILQNFPIQIIGHHANNQVLLFLFSFHLIQILMVLLNVVLN